MDLEQTTTLLNDLEVARQWAGAGSQLTAVYAAMLEKVGEVGKALTVLSEEASSSDRLRLMLADMAKRHGREKTFNEITEGSKRRIEQRILQGEADIQDYVNMASLLLLEGDAKRAHRALDRALRLDPENKDLKRLRSEAFRLEYLQSLRAEGGQVQVKLGLLDAALKSDPSNPAVGEEIAKLIAMGKETSEQFDEALKRQLGSGQSTALTHILLAERDLRSGEIAKAIPRLQLALHQAPGNPTALNNLALALAMTDKNQIDRALQLSQAAVAAVPSKAEYVDTLGEIQEIAGELPGAIACYEKAIGLDPNRNQTRQKLANAYRKMGLEDMAQVQLKLIAESQQK